MLENTVMGKDLVSIFVGLFFRRVDSGLCQVVGSCLIWGLGTKLKSSSRAAILLLIHLSD